MKRGHDDMEVFDEMDMAVAEDSACKRVKTNESHSLVALQLDKILNYLEVDSSTRENSNALLGKIFESIQSPNLQENPIYHAGAVIWIIKKLAAQKSSSFFIGRIFAVCEKIDISESNLSIKSFIAVLKTVVTFLENNQLTSTSDLGLIAESLQRIEIMLESLQKIHHIYTRTVNLLFRPKSVVDPEKYYEFTKYLWILYCYGRGMTIFDSL